MSMYDFSNTSWAGEIASITELPDYQTCEIQISYSGNTLEAYDYLTNVTYTVDSSLSSVASSLDDDALLTALALPPGTPLFRQDTVTPVGLEGNVWVRNLGGVFLVFLYESGWKPAPTNSVIYEGQARYIPIRAGVWQGGEAQVNANTIRAVRFQVPFGEQPARVYAGSIITITSAEFNPGLLGRTAKVTDDFQGSTTASRTINAMMDSDSEDDDG